MAAPLGVFFAVLRRWTCLLAGVALLHACPALGAGDPTYLSELVARARQLHLAERVEWLKLGHYVPNLLRPGVHSLVDSPNFFNASDGKTNPRTELEATLAAFFSDVTETNERQNPQCAFIARRAWLDAQLHFDPQRLPPQPCSRYRHWHDALDPAGLTVIFASAYLNNPGSMYGHTLLRVDARDQNERTRLLAYTINFAANTTETNGISFAVNGLFGGYPGTFSILPYYVKVREYSDMENRDIWEYQLALTPEEIDRVLRHAWELGPTYFQYFFFDENCSYQLNALLQVARPQLDLTDRFRWWAIPTDTVRAITSQPGLVRRIVYRPSNATVIRRRIAVLDSAERKTVLELSRGGSGAKVLSALAPARSAAVLEAAHDYVAYRHAIGEPDVADPAALERRLLVERSRVDAPAQTPAVPRPAVAPDEGHDTARLGLAIGRRDGVDFQDLRLRPTYQDIIDPDAGYSRGAQIEYFDLGLRHYDSQATRVERFVPVDIVSLGPRDDFFHPWSWRVAAGWNRVRAAAGGEPLAFTLDGGGGGAWGSEARHGMFYALAEGSVHAHRALEDGYALGAGASAGAIIDVTPRWRVHAYLRGTRYFAGQRDTPWSFGIEQRYTLGHDVALRLDLARRRELGHRYNFGSAMLHFYF